MKIDGLKIRQSKYIDGPNQCGYFTAGIDVEVDGNNWHDHAIEFHSKMRELAERRRDIVLQALTGVKK